MLHFMKISTSLLVIHHHPIKYLYLALLNLVVLMSMMLLLQAKRCQRLCRYISDGRVPSQPHLLYHLHICHLQTFTCPLPFGKVHVSPQSILFLILLAMIAFTLLFVRLLCLLLINQFLENYQEVLLLPQWKAAMDDEMDALVSRRTWTLVHRPKETNVVTCRWVFAIKYRPDGMVDSTKLA